MKKIFLSLLIAGLAVPSAFALMVGPVDTVGQGKFAVVADDSYVFSQALRAPEFSEANVDPGFTGFYKLKVNAMNTSLVGVEYGLLNDLDIYGKVGAMDFSAKAFDVDNWGAGYELSSAKTCFNNAFAYNAGIKGKVDIKDGWFVGGDAQYMMALPRVEEKGTGLGFGDGVTYAYGEKMNATFQQWQVSAVVGKEIGSFTPYAGGTYSDLSLKSKHNLVPGFETNLNFQAKDHGGALVGTDYKVTSNISLNIEGQFINETSVSVSAKYKF